MAAVAEDVSASARGALAAAPHDADACKSGRSEGAIGAPVAEVGDDDEEDNDDRDGDLRDDCVEVAAVDEENKEEDAVVDVDGEDKEAHEKEMTRRNEMTR